MSLLRTLQRPREDTVPHSDVPSFAALPILAHLALSLTTHSCLSLTLGSSNEELQNAGDISQYGMMLILFTCIYT